MDKWAEKYGIDVEIVQINEYVASINQYTVGAFDGVSATNMDALSIPARGGVDTTALIVGTSKKIGIVHFDRNADIQEKDLDERMHTTPWLHSANLPNVPAKKLVQVCIGG